MIDPELAAIVDLLPKIDLVDPVAARQAFEEMLAGITLRHPRHRDARHRGPHGPGPGGRPRRGGAALPAEGGRGGDTACPAS